ncbi:MAG TPA: hypothetical protein VNY30_10800, partial [Bryobacteraceae bacterium]|nr:hypothetical protein [Bryobacteraceae bacterium]
MLSRDDAKNIIDKVVSYSKLPQCRVDLNWTEDVFIRFANNGITTSGYRITQQASISSVTEDKREGNAVVSELTDAALKRGVEQSEQLARISQPNPEDMPALGPQKYLELKNFDSFTGSARGDVMIPHVKAVIDSAKENKLTAAGFI